MTIRSYLPDTGNYHFVHNLNLSLSRRKEVRQCCGPYMVTARDNVAGNPMMYYSRDDQGNPGDGCFNLRAEPAIGLNHNGWCTTADCDGDTIKPIIFRLNSNRGFLSGWTAGANMYSGIDPSVIHDNEIDASNYADECARVVAEQQQEYDEAQDDEDEDEDEDVVDGYIGIDSFDIDRLTEYRTKRHNEEYFEIEDLMDLLDSIAGV